MYLASFGLRVVVLSLCYLVTSNILTHMYHFKNTQLIMFTSIGLMQLFFPYLLIFEYRVKHTIHWEICCKPFPSGSGRKRCSFKSLNRREVMKQFWCLVDIFKVPLPLFRKYKETHGYPGRKRWESLYLCSLMNSKFLHKEAKRSFK